MNVLLAFSGIMAIALLTLLLIRLRYDRLVKQVWRSFKTPATGSIFTHEMVANLDEPVRRYFLHAIELGTPLASYVELKMSGGFKFKPDAEWLPMQAKEIVSMSSGFVWQAKIGRGLFKFSGADYHKQGKGRTKFFWGLIPLVDARNADVARSSAARLAAEYIWLPSALLPHHNVVWQAISNNTIQARFHLNAEPITLTLNINGDGKLCDISLPRWSNDTEDRTWQYIPFGAEAKTEITLDGYTIPAQIDVGYWFGTEGYWAFFRAQIERAQFY